MKTQLLTSKDINTAAKIIEEGGIIAFRTETVFGIAADAYNETAREKIFIAKNRPPEKNLVMQFPSIKHAQKHFPGTIDKRALAVLEHFRGITIILNNNQGIRIPNDPIAKKVLRACKNPLVVTSANISGETPATNWETVNDTLGGRLDAIIKSTPSRLRTPSTIVRLHQFYVEVIREGTTPSQDVIDFYDKHIV